MNVSYKEEWSIGNLLNDPEKLFILWAIRSDLCSSYEDFKEYYGKDYPIEDLVSGLTEEGFLKVSKGRLILTNLASETLDSFSYLEAPESIADRPVHESPSDRKLTKKSPSSILKWVTKLLTQDHISGTEYLAFQFSPEGIETEHAGRLIYYVDLSRFLNGKNYEFLDEICEMMADHITKEKISFDYIVGLPIVGSHIGVLLARLLKKPYAILGKERDIAEQGNPIDVVEGYVPKPQEEALIFDDAIVTAESVIKASQILRRAGVIVKKAYTFLDKQHGGSELLAREGIECYALLRGEEFASSLLEMGILSPKETEAILIEAKQMRKKRI